MRRERDQIQVVQINPEKEAEAFNHTKMALIAWAIASGVTFFNPLAGFIMAVEVDRQVYLAVKNME